jgi:hypothetical protein
MFLFFTCIAVSGDRESKLISLDIGPVFYHTISKFVQALVVTYDEIFQALAVEGEVLLPRPFLDPPPPSPSVQPRLGPLGLSSGWQTEKTSPRPAMSI